MNKKFSHCLIEFYNTNFVCTKTALPSENDLEEKINCQAKNVSKVRTRSIYIARSLFFTSLKFSENRSPFFYHYQALGS